MNQNPQPKASPVNQPLRDALAKISTERNLKQSSIAKTRIVEAANDALYKSGVDNLSKLSEVDKLLGIPL